MTPERIEEIKQTLDDGEITRDLFYELLAALEEAQQDLECFRAKTEPESLGYGAKWKQNALAAREERDTLRDELAEAQQTIARKQLYIEKLELSRESAQQAADNISKEKGLELFEARQTIARQREALEKIKSDGACAGNNSYYHIANSALEEGETQP